MERGAMAMANIKHNNRKRKNRSRQQMRCPVCGASIRRLPESEMGFQKHREGGPAYFWTCKNYPACNTYVKENRHTGLPDGTLAGPALRHKRIVLHQFALALSASGLYDKGTFWDAARAVLSAPKLNTLHASSLSEYQCDLVLEHFSGVVDRNPQVRRCIYPGQALYRYLNEERIVGRAS